MSFVVTFPTWLPGLGLICFGLLTVLNFSLKQAMEPETLSRWPLAISLGMIAGGTFTLLT